MSFINDIFDYRVTKKYDLAFFAGGNNIPNHIEYYRMMGYYRVTQAYLDSLENYERRVSAFRRALTLFR